MSYPPAYRTRPDRCAQHKHPGVTYNPWLHKTWCLCGDVIQDGNCFDPRHMACCGGPLTERINTHPIHQPT